MGLFMGYPNSIRQQKTGPAQVSRETIGPSPQQLRQAGLADTGTQSLPSSLLGGYQSPSQGIFQAYMQNIFNQKYAPPVIPGSQGSVQQFNGYRGFGSPSMPQVQSPMQQQMPNPAGYTPSPGSPSIPWYIYNQA